MQNVSLKSLQEDAADDISRRHFQMQIFLALSGLIRLGVCKKMIKTDFQYDGWSGHLVYPINMILAHFDPEVFMLLQSKFWLKSTKGLGRDVENLFSRWQLWQPSWNLIGSSISAILYLLGAPMLLIKFQHNWIIVFRGDVQNMNSQHFFPYKWIGPIQMHAKANLTLP